MVIGFKRDSFRAPFYGARPRSVTEFPPAGELDTRPTATDHVLANGIHGTPMKMIQIRETLLSITLLLAAACSNTGASDASTARLEDASIGGVPNLHAFGDVLLAGQPGPGDWALLEESGVRTVINLRHERELQGFDEERAVSEAGMRYVALPWSGADELTDEVFDRSRELLETAERPLVLHCASANRVGAVWLPWRVLDGGASWEDALAEAKAIGMRTPAYEELARKYVEARSGRVGGSR